MGLDPAAQPDSQEARGEAENVGEHHVERRSGARAGGEEPDGLVLVRREGGVGADESHRREVAPVRVQLATGVPGEEELYDQASGDVDEERSIRRDNPGALA